MDESLSTNFLRITVLLASSENVSGEKKRDDVTKDADLIIYSKSITYMTVNHRNSPKHQ